MTPFGQGPVDLSIQPTALLIFLTRTTRAGLVTTNFNFGHGWAGIMGESGLEVVVLHSVFEQLAKIFVGSTAQLDFVPAVGTVTACDAQSCGLVFASAEK